jgi:hypothetical protein
MLQKNRFFSTGLSAATGNDIDNIWWRQAIIFPIFRRRPPPGIARPVWIFVFSDALCV